MRYPLFGVAQTSKSLTVTAQRRLNLYAEVTGMQEDKTAIAFYPTPGLLLFADLGAQKVRGWRVAGARWFVVVGANLYELSSVGVATARGVLSTNSGQIDMSDNGVQLFMCDGSNGYTLTLATNVFAAVADPDFPGASSCFFDAGYILVTKPSTSEFYISALYDATSWAALDFANAESSPDNLTRVYCDSGNVILFGVNTTEFWTNTGALDFPYQKVGSATVEWGLVAKWSVAKFNKSICCLMRNLLGQQQVVALSGYTPQPISTPEVDNVISKYSTVSDAVGFSYNLGGHAMYEINFPTEGKTWLYDGTTNLWSELESDGGRHWADQGIQFNGQTYVSDYATGRIYQLDPESYTDNGTSIARELVARHVFNEERQPLSVVWVEFQPGVGAVSGPGSMPVASLQISRDGGFTYGPEKFASIGALGEYTARARWLRNGRARDFVLKLRLTDPVYPVIAGAYLDIAA